MSDYKLNDKNWLELLKLLSAPLIVAILCYLPAFILVILGAWLFRPSNTLSPEPTKESITISQEELNQRISKELGNLREEDLEQLQAQRAIASDSPNSVMAQGYLDSQIRQEVGIQTGEAVRSAVDELKSDWKGDLFSQISFPMVFAIASIFAAFAVKDILVEILKDQEKSKLKKALENELETFVSDSVETAIASKIRDITNDIKELEAYTYWLEHELLDIEISQSINRINQCDISKTGLLNSKEEETNVAALKALFDRSKNALEKVSADFVAGSDFLRLEKARNKVLEMKVSSSNLSQMSQVKLMDQLQKYTDWDESDPVKESIQARMEELLKTQMSVLIATLSKLPEDDRFLDDLISALSSDGKRQERQERVKESRERADEKGSLYPKEIDEQEGSTD